MKRASDAALGMLNFQICTLKGRMINKTKAAYGGRHQNLIMFSNENTPSTWHGTANESKPVAKGQVSTSDYSEHYSNYSLLLY